MTLSHIRSQAIRSFSCLALYLPWVTSPRILTRASVMIVPEADQVNTSICPGVSIKTYLCQKRPLEKFLLMHSERYSIPQNINIWLLKTEITPSHFQVSLLPIALKVHTTFPGVLFNVQYSGSLAGAAIHHCCKWSQRKLTVLETHCIKNER